MKKIISVLLAVMTMAAICIPAFASETEYDWTKDPALEAVEGYYDGKDGNFVFGGYAPAMYSVKNNCFYALNSLPSVKETSRGNAAKVIKDSLNYPINCQGIETEMLYAMVCTECHAWNSATTLRSIYEKEDGKCYNCKEKLLPVESYNIYGFVMIKRDSAHYNACKEIDIAGTSNLGVYSNIKHRLTGLYSMGCVTVKDGEIINVNTAEELGPYNSAFASSAVVTVYAGNTIFTKIIDLIKNILKIFR